jgi:hypothetical protein
MMYSNTTSITQSLNNNTATTTRLLTVRKCDRFFSLICTLPYYPILPRVTVSWPVVARSLRPLLALPKRHPSNGVLATTTHINTQHPDPPNTHPHNNTRRDENHWQSPSILAKPSRLPPPILLYRPRLAQKAKQPTQAPRHPHASTCNLDQGPQLSRTDYCCLFTLSYLLSL